jgi:hypothetical protein
MEIIFLGYVEELSMSYRFVAYHVEIKWIVNDPEIDFYLSVN